MVMTVASKVRFFVVTATKDSFDTLHGLLTQNPIPAPSVLPVTVKSR